MNNEREWFRTPHGAKDSDTSDPVYRAICVDGHKGAYVLISEHNKPGVKGTRDVTKVLFDDPNVLIAAIEQLRADGVTQIKAKGSVTRSHEAWDHSGDRGDWQDEITPDEQIGMISVELKLEQGALAPFEPVIQVEVAAQEMSR